MKDTVMYEQLLGLKSPWSVKKVDLSLADQRVVGEVVLKKGQVWADPTDATKRANAHSYSRFPTQLTKAGGTRLRRFHSVLGSRPPLS